MLHLCVPRQKRNPILFTIHPSSPLLPHPSYGSLFHTALVLFAALNSKLPAVHGFSLLSRVPVLHPFLLPFLPPSLPSLQATLTTNLSTPPTSGY